MLAEFNVPVIVEVILERVTNISMGTEIDAINEFEELAANARRRADRDQHARLIDASRRRAYALHRPRH